MNATATLTEEQRIEAWLADRRSGIGGSEVAAIILAPEDRPRWCSPINVWLDKKGMAEHRENNAMRAGKRFERTILEMYSDQVGQPIEFADHWAFLRDPELHLLGASLDARWAAGDRRPVDAKNIRYKDGSKWGDAGSEQMPLYYACQLTVQMMVTGTEVSDLAVLFSGQDLENFHAYYDPETAAIIRERVAVWWERHIVQGHQPEMDGTDAASDYLRKRFARATDRTVEPTQQVLDLIRQRREAYAAEQAAKLVRQEAENKIKAFMGDAQAIPGLCTWKNNRGSTEVNHEGALLELLSTLERQGVKGVRQTAQTILEQFTTTTTGARVLRFAKGEIE
jgi:putative phage-type endonuclease